MPLHGLSFYRSCVLLENERYLLFALCKDEETYLQVYDIATDTVVRQGHALNFDEVRPSDPGYRGFSLKTAIFVRELVRLFI